MRLNSPYLKTSKEKSTQFDCHEHEHKHMNSVNRTIHVNSCLSSLPYAIVYKQSERNYQLSTLANTSVHTHTYAHTFAHIYWTLVHSSRFNYSQHKYDVSNCYFVSIGIDAKTVYCWIYLVLGLQSKTINFLASLVYGRHIYIFYLTSLNFAT